MGARKMLRHDAGIFIAIETLRVMKV